jgi:hypothetical protein
MVARNPLFQLRPGTAAGGGLISATNDITRGAEIGQQGIYNNPGNPGVAGTGGDVLAPTTTTEATTATDPLAPGAGMDPFTGFASRYTPAMADLAYENPWYILRDLFPNMSESSPLYQALRDLGGDPLTLFNIIAGSQQKIDQGAGDFINWLADMYGNMGRPGGAAFSAPDLIATLFGQTEFGADSQNTLGQILGAGDMSTQVRTLFNMLRDVSNVGMNPLAARGYQAAIAQAGDRYGNAMMSSDENTTMNPTQFIAENMPWLAGR